MTCLGGLRPPKPPTAAEESGRSHCVGPLAGTWWMRWLAPTRSGQRGVSLVEAVVASALLGVGVVGGITAWDTATLSAGKAVRQAWARCMVRSEVDAIASAPWNDTLYPSPNANLQVAVSPRQPGEQLVTVVARDPQSGSMLFQASLLKTTWLSGDKAMNTGVLNDVQYGCPES